MLLAALLRVNGFTRTVAIQACDNASPHVHHQRIVAQGAILRDAQSKQVCELKKNLFRPNLTTVQIRLQSNYVQAKMVGQGWTLGPRPTEPCGLEAVLLFIQPDRCE